MFSHNSKYMWVYRNCRNFDKLLTLECTEILFYNIQISIAKKSGPTSRIPLPTGRYFLNLSPPPGELPPPKTLSASNLPTSGNLRPQKSSGLRRTSGEQRKLTSEPSKLPSGTPGSTPLSPVTQYRSREQKEGRELLEMPKANATSLPQPQSRHAPAPPNSDATSGAPDA